MSQSSNTISCFNLNPTGFDILWVKISLVYHFQYPDCYREKSIHVPHSRSQSAYGSRIGGSGGSIHNYANYMHHSGLKPLKRWK